MDDVFGELYRSAAARGWRSVCRLVAHEAAEMWRARSTARREHATRFPPQPWATRTARLTGALLLDLRYAIRALRRDAAWSVLVVVILGVGVGAASSVFSVAQALLLRPLPFGGADRLVWIANGTSENLSAQTVQVGHLLDLRERTRAFSVIAGFSPFYGVGDVLATGGENPERLTAVPVTDNFFPALGVSAYIGRTFVSTDAAPGAQRTAVLSYASWQRRFGGRPDVIGREMQLDGATVAIVGVLPQSFDFSSAFTPGGGADLFEPFPLSPDADKQGNTLALVGRLRPDATLAFAQADTAAYAEESRRININRNAFRPHLTPLREHVSGKVKQPVAMLAGAVGVLMLIVCTNLSQLLLVRTATRRHEFGVRTALGARRRQLVQQMLVESLVLALLGTALGLVLALIGTRMIARLDSTIVPLLADVRVDRVVLAFTGLSALVAALGFGVLPALRVSAVARRSLEEGGRASIGMSHRWTVRTIVVTQIALACVLVSGTVLLARSFREVLNVRPGFDGNGLITLRVDPSGRDLTTEQKNSYFDAILRHARAVPGVDAVALTDAWPLGRNFGWRTWDVSATKAVVPTTRQFPLVRMVDEGYFSAMRIGLRTGRPFAADDSSSSELVVIINDTLAGKLWPGEGPVGRTVWTSNGRVARRVVGVVHDVHYFGLDRETGPEMYLPLRQTGNYRVVDLIIRTRLPVAAVAPGLRAALNRADPDLPSGALQTMDQLVSQSVSVRRFIVMLTSGFAAFALALAALGIYAVSAYAVAQRRREIACRLALGASPRSLRIRFLAQSCVLAAVGLCLGMPASWLAARQIRNLLFNVAPDDVTTFLVVPAMLAAVAGIAGYLPARRASRVDPATLLRGD
jgi:predicted permease